MNLFDYFNDGIKNESNNHQGSYNQGQVQSPNPQTPSSIPEIILTGKKISYSSIGMWLGNYTPSQNCKLEWSFNFVLTEFLCSWSFLGKIADILHKPNSGHDTDRF